MTMGWLIENWDKVQNSEETHEVFEYSGTKRVDAIRAFVR